MPGYATIYALLVAIAELFCVFASLTVFSAPFALVVSLAYTRARTIDLK